MIKSCSFDRPCVLFLLCLFVALVVSHFVFEGRNLVLIVSVPGHCLLFTFCKSCLFEGPFALRLRPSFIFLFIIQYHDEKCKAAFLVYSIGGSSLCTTSKARKGRRLNTRLIRNPKFAR